MKKLFIIPAFLLILSCNTMNTSGKASSDKTDLCTNLVSSQNNGKEEPTNLIIRTQDGLESLYKSVGRDEVPKVDFTKSQVIALFLGTKNTGGYSISVDKVVEENGKLVIYKKVESPKGMATMALTNPFVIAEIHSKKEIIFR